MNFRKKTTLALAVLALTASNFVAAQTTLLNASYDVAREFYKDINTAFIANYKKTTGKDIKIDQAHGGSSAQARAVNDGLDADVVTFQVGSTVRRTDRQQDMGLLLAMVDTVTLDRSTALAVSDDTHPGGSVQKPRSIGDTKPPTNIPLPHEGLSYRFPFDTEKKTYPYFDPIAQKAFDANYEGEDDVNGLTAYKFVQNVGYDADGKLVEPIKFSSLYDKDEDGSVTARAELAREVQALCALAKRPEMADKFIKAATPLQDVRAEIFAALEADYEHVDTAPPAKQTQNSGAQPSAVKGADIWAARRQKTAK